MFLNAIGIVDSLKKLTLDIYNSNWKTMVDWWNDHDSGARAWTSLSANGLNMNSNKITKVANGTASDDAANFGQIKVIQTLSANQGTTFTSTGTTFVSQVSVTIVPTSASNRILIWASMPLSLNGVGTAYASIFRGSTNLATANTPVHNAFAISNVNGYTPCAMIYIDSPSTTSSTSYSLQTAADGTHAVGLADGVATIQVMEIV